MTQDKGETTLGQTATGTVTQIGETAAADTVQGNGQLARKGTEVKLVGSKCPGDG